MPEPTVERLRAALVERLRAALAARSAGPVEQAAVRVSERVVLQKFDGSPPTPDAPKDPIETIELLFENGQLISDSTVARGGAPCP